MSLVDDVPTGNIDDIDADALLNQIEQGESAPEAPITEAPPAPEPKPQEFSFNWNGKEIKADQNRIIQWASQGYDYAQRMAEHNRKASEFEQQQKSWEEKYAPFKTIEEYAAQNPQWWQYVVSNYENQLNQPSGNPAQAAIPPELENKLKSFEEFKNSIESEKVAKQRESEDQKLVSEIESIRKDYANLDWDTVDDQGQSLEHRVLKHAIDNGIQSFRAAFRDFNHENLLKLAEERGKENINKDLQKRTKLGLLGSSSTPKKELTNAENVKSKSYAQLTQEALAELGII